MSTKNISIPQSVREFLKQKPPLSVIELDDLYRNVATKKSEREHARSALHRHAAGTPVSKQSKTSAYYAIRLTINYSDSASDDVFLSLPGIPRERILQDIASTGTVDDIISDLTMKYGKATIQYWGNVAQYGTVAQARKGMNKAKGRDRTCRLCEVTNNIRQKAGLPRIKPKPIRASHIVSRRTTFWTILDAVEKSGNGIFSDNGVAIIKQRLKNDPFHSDEQFIIGLCTEHDSLLLESLREAANS